MSVDGERVNASRGASIAHDFNCTHDPCRCRESTANPISETDRRYIDEWAAQQALGWQDETLDHGPVMRRIVRVLVAAVDAWRGERRDWRRGSSW